MQPKRLLIAVLVVILMLGAAVLALMIFMKKLGI